MTTKTEPLHTGGFIISEANGFRSREVATVVSGQVVTIATFTGGDTITFGGGTGDISHNERIPVLRNDRFASVWDLATGTQVSTQEADLWASGTTVDSIRSPPKNTMSSGGVPRLTRASATARPGNTCPPVPAAAIWLRRSPATTTTWGYSLRFLFRPPQP